MESSAGSAEGRGVLRLERRGDGVAVVLLGVDGDPGNALMPTDLGELVAMLEEHAAERAVRGLVLASAGEGFSSGIAFPALASLVTVNDGADLAREAQRATSALERHPVPVVAAIHGACVGLGLELAIACRARVASDEPNTQLGLPHIAIGLAPFAGATQRLPRVVGAVSAVDLLIRGHLLDARRARQIGLVDAICARGALIESAALMALALGSRRDHGSGVLAAISRAAQRGLGGPARAFEREVVVAQARRRLDRHGRAAAGGALSPGHVLAASRVLDAVSARVDPESRQGYELERQGFGALVSNQSTQREIELALALGELERERLRAGHGRDQLRSIAVLGTGSPAAEIARAAVTARVSVKLAGEANRLVAALNRVRAQLSSAVANGALRPEEQEAALGRLSATSDLGTLRGAQLIVDAREEDAPDRPDALREILRPGAPELPLAVALSASDLCLPDHISGRAAVGLRYGRPHPRSALLEVVATPASSPEAVRIAAELGRLQLRAVIVIQHGPGSYTPRLLAALTGEALQLLSEGVPPDELAAALRDWGFTWGPIELIDSMGLARWRAAAARLAALLGGRLAQPELLGAMLAQSRIAGGFGRGRSAAASVRALLPAMQIPRARRIDPAEIVQRCALRLVNEAVHCFAEGVSGGARDGDVGAVLGAGFPSRRGGPLRFVDDVGPGEVLRRLQRFERDHGPRFAPSPLLRRLAGSGGSFHGSARHPDADRERTRPPADP